MGYYNVWIIEIELEEIEKIISHEIMKIRGKTYKSIEDLEKDILNCGLKAFEKDKYSKYSSRFKSNYYYNKDINNNYILTKVELIRS